MRQKCLSISNYYYVYLGEINYDIGQTIDPMSCKKVISCPQFDEWLKVIKEVM